MSGFRHIRRGGRIGHVLRPFIRCITALAVIGWAAVFPAFAQHTEHQMQAAVLGNLGKFIVWPESAQPKEAIRIGILGHDPFGKDIEAVLKEARVKGKPFVIERSGNIRDLLDCHIIYFSSSETEKLTEARAMIGRRPIVTVGEKRGFLERGGMINFHLENSRIRFGINLKSVEQAGIVIHTQVLRLASEVKK